MDAAKEELSYKAVENFTVLVRGMHTGMDARLLQVGQYARGINMTTRGGLAKTRPAFQKEGLKLGSGTFNGAGVYSLDAGDSLVYAIDGQIYVREIDGSTTTISGWLMDAGRCYFTQVYRWMVIQDGVNRPIVLENDGGVTSRLERDVVNDSEETLSLICMVPGTVGHYSHGRYHFVPTENPLDTPALEVDPDDASKYTYESLNALPDTDPDETGRTGFVSTDITDNLNRYTVFRMSEHRVINEGGLYGLPAEFGFVHGIRSIRGAATGTGVGGMFVFGASGVSAFDVSLPRGADEGGKSWKDISFSQVAFTGPGTRSPFALVNINDDIWYVDVSNNVRSVAYDSSQLSSGSQAAPALFNTTKSFEAQRWVDQTSAYYRPEVSAAHADNRFVWTLCDGRALGSIDFAQTYTATPTELPILHEGIWTGFEYKQVLQIHNDLGIIVQQDEDLWLLAPGGDKDLGTTRIVSELVTRATGMMYNETYQTMWLKKLLEVDLQISNITQSTDVTVYFRPSTYPEWIELGTKSFFIPEGSPPQSRVNVKFMPNYAIDSDCDPISKRSNYHANLFQFKIVWEGRATIDQFNAWAQKTAEPPKPLCEADNPTGAEYPSDTDDDFSYHVTIGADE